MRYARFLRVADACFDVLLPVYASARHFFRAFVAHACESAVIAGVITLYSATLLP